MFKLTLNGEPLTEQSLERAFVQAATAELRARLGAVRHPVTGEFPTIAAVGSSLDDLRITVEGSPELLKLVRERLADKEDATSASQSGSNTTAGTSERKVFLSYASEDSELAGRIAATLQANGIATWWAEWCINAGDSIRQRIDEGIAGCTHFIVLLTPQSAVKPWVRQEMDAGLMRKLRQEAQFIALRSDLSTAELPPLLQGMLSPSVDADAFDLAQLIDDIHGITKKPPLGPVPAIVTESAVAQTGLSPAATALARLYVERTDYARKFEPHFTTEQLAMALGMSEEDVADAAHELSGYVTVHHGDLVYAEDELFVRFDKFWKSWDPATDALHLATAMVNDAKFPQLPKDIAVRLGWDARRLNPALAFLANRKLAVCLKSMTGDHWLLATIMKSDATRRFVKSRSG